MRKTTLEEWKIIRNEPPQPYLTHCIYEGDYPNFAFYFSQIEEWGLMKYCTRLQVYVNKERPQKIYDSGAARFIYDIFNDADFAETNFVYDWTKDNFACFRRIINKGRNIYSFPFMIFNLSNQTFATIDGSSLSELKRDGLSSVTGVRTIEEKGQIKRIDALEHFKFEEMTWIALSGFADFGT